MAKKKIDPDFFDGDLCICPCCGAGWGIEEISFQECDSCGYPDSDEESDFEDYEERDNDYGEWDD